MGLAKQIWCLGALVGLSMWAGIGMFLSFQAYTGRSIIATAANSTAEIDPSVYEAPIKTARR